MEAELLAGSKLGESVSRVSSLEYASTGATASSSLPDTSG
jgi:hypothetical protein